MFLLIVLLELI